MNIDEKKGERVSGKVSYISCKKRINKFTENADIASTVQRMCHVTFQR